MECDGCVPLTRAVFNLMTGVHGECEEKKGTVAFLYPVYLCFSDFSVFTHFISSVKQFSLYVHSRHTRSDMPRPRFYLPLPFLRR